MRRPICRSLAALLPALLVAIPAPRSALAGGAGEVADARAAFEAAADDELSSRERIELLEKKLYTALRYIDQIREELEELRGDDPSAPLAERHSDLWYQPARPQYRYVASSTAVPDGPQPAGPSLEEQEEAEVEQETPELQAAFLREARAVLLPRGKLEMTPGLSFTHTNRNDLLLRGVDLIENIFIGTIDVGRVKRNSLIASYALRYGLTNRFQLNLTVPYVRSSRQRLLEPEVQRQLGEPTEIESDDAGLGDIEGGLSYHLLREGEWLPDLIVSASFKSDTGTSPFEVGPNELATGTGFLGIRGGATIVKVSDPAVLFMNAGYFYHIKKDDVNGFKAVDPPDSIDFGLGFSYALNPFLSITTRFATSYSVKTKIETAIGEAEIDGSDQVTASLSFGLTYALSQRSSLDISAGIGLTDDSPDFTLRAAMPMVFDVPTLWSDAGLRLGRLWPF
ncbi:MAG: transporter [Myxococcota bacterium]